MTENPGVQPRSQVSRVVAIVGVVFVLATGAFGWFLGDLALTQPALTVDIEESYVEVLAGDDEVIVSVTWLLDASGGVSLSVDEVESGSDEPLVPVAFLLHGDARFEELSSATKADMRLLDPSDPDSAQLVVLKDYQGPPSPTIYSARGSSMGTWHGTGAGRRVAQLPRIQVNGPNRLLTEKDGAGATFWGVSETSALRSTALTAPGDQLVHHYPDAPESGVTVEQGWDQESTYQEGVSWVKTEGEVDPSRILRGGGELPPAYMRWENPEDVARGQRDLLISGALLGVASALAIEGSMWWIARKVARPAPPAARPSSTPST